MLFDALEMVNSYWGLPVVDENFCKKLAYGVEQIKSLKHFLAVEDDVFNESLAGIGVLEYASIVNGKEDLVEDPNIASIIVASYIRS